MQSMFCLAQAHKAVWIVEKNKADGSWVYHIKTVPF
jgi:hypothetical protein